ncbi:MAG TPA: tyrosine-type recombinase/integrase [Polyangiales bacterium]|nr:tyrosine-type recombinase/integrase [Polyangiales bacterium]
MSGIGMGRQICPGLWQLKSATFLVRVQKVDPRTGRKLNRARKLKGVTRTQALQTMEDLRRELERGFEEQRPIAITNQTTLGSYAASWLTTKLERGDLAPSTANRYATALDHLSPWLKQMPLSEIAPRDVEQWMVAARKQGFAPGTVNSWLRVVRAVFSDALRDRLVAANAAQQVRPLIAELDLEETNSLSTDELRRVLTAFKSQNHVIHAAAWTQAITGLRWGEVSALKWEDHDEDSRVLLIRRAVCDRKLRPLTKTRKARIVGVPEALAEVLSSHRERLVAAEHPGLASGLMFPSMKGTPLANSRIWDALQEACQEAGIKRRFTSHGFRRTLTDMLRNARVDPVVAAGLTGHETERMRRHYSTVRSSEAVEAGERVVRLLQPQSESIEESTQESESAGRKKGSSRAER